MSQNLIRWFFIRWKLQLHLQIEVDGPLVITYVSISSYRAYQSRRLAKSHSHSHSHTHTHTQLLMQPNERTLIQMHAQTNTQTGAHSTTTAINTTTTTEITTTIATTASTATIDTTQKRIRKRTRRRTRRGARITIPMPIRRRILNRI
jgi:prophage tail gpP-like protein